MTKTSRNMKSSEQVDFRPGTLGYYLTEAGWQIVQPSGNNQEKGENAQHPLWRKNGREYAAYDAWQIECGLINHPELPNPF